MFFQLDFKYCTSSIITSATKYNFYSFDFFLSYWREYGVDSRVDSSLLSTNPNSLVTEYIEVKLSAISLK